MTPRRLGFAEAATRDLQRRARQLASVCDESFGHQFAAELKAWLEQLAAGGAQVGTAVGDDPAVRSFGYKKQATILARFEAGGLIVLRVNFRGQDWSRRPGDR